MRHHRQPGAWFFLVLGFGLHAKDTRRYRLSFSERNNLGPPAIMLGAWRVSLITPFSR